METKSTMNVFIYFSHILKTQEKKKCNVIIVYSNISQSKEFTSCKQTFSNINWKNNNLNQLHRHCLLNRNIEHNKCHIDECDVTIFSF